MSDSPSKEFIILLAAIIATGIVFTLLFTVNVWKPVYSSQKVAEKAVSAPVQLPANVKVILPAPKSDVHPCDPAKDYGCGAWVKHHLIETDDNGQLFQWTWMEKM